MLEAIKLSNLLSFGAETEIVFNKGLNVLIGANGSGKSNLIEGISLLKALPSESALAKTISDGGGIAEWIWKGAESQVLRLEAVSADSHSFAPMKHKIELGTQEHQVKVLNESIDVFDDENNQLSHLSERELQEWFYERGYIQEHYFLPCYSYDGNSGILNGKFSRHDDSTWNASSITLTNLTNTQSILSQLQDAKAYPEIFHLAERYKNIRLYREWQFGRKSPVRTLQKADLKNDFLEEDASNLALILSQFRLDKTVKSKLKSALQTFYDSFEDYEVLAGFGYVNLYFQEKDGHIPAARLSDGTLRYLSLLAILLHPNPPPLICIEEPELGLHPDIVPELIELLKEAAQKTQIIITTHSADLVDCLSDTPEAVLVFDKYEGSTSVQRLSKEDLSEWLSEYRLGQLWRKGHLGGNRW